MKKEIIIDREPGLTRAAVLEDGNLAEFYQEKEGAEKISGNIYKGRVQNVVSGIQAAFVDIGTDKNAFLFLGDAEMDARDFTFGGQADETAKAALSAKKAVKNNQEILVQATKEPDGDKGARVSAHIGLPGRYVVLTPQDNYIGVSRRITNDEERTRLRGEALKAKPESYGLILRTAAQGMNAEELKPDIDALCAKWETVEKAGKTAKAPACVYQDAALTVRVVRDLLTEDTERLLLPDHETYETVMDALQVTAPELCGRCEEYTGSMPIFDTFRIESKLDKALQHKVWLKSGGYLYIDPTEAMTVIDVNTGKFTGSRELEETLIKINCEAAVEIARQLRLRDIGGIIIIDFIDMEQEESREKVLSALKTALKSDRNRTNVVGFTGLGLVEMTRRKLRTKLSGTLQTLCPVCEGTGRVIQPEFTARKALREYRRQKASGSKATIEIKLNPAVMAALKELAPDLDAKCTVISSMGPNDYHVAPVIGKTAKEEEA